jgi:CRISPR type IV-associated DEAD/DEAH-box helicase Csf4
MRLYDYQEDFKKIAMKKMQNKCFFAEIPTGAGKSVISADIAETYAKQGKKVIISTTTNHLAKEIADLLANKNPKIIFDTSVTSSLSIGKNNYFNIDKINDEIKALFIDKKQIDEYLNSIKDKSGYWYLFDTMFEHVEIEEDNKKIIKSLVQEDEKRKPYMTDIGECDISVTNHSYLLFKSFNENFNDYAVIFDEAHAILESAESAFTSSFSVYRLKILIDMIIKHIIDKKGKGFPAGIKNLFYVKKFCNKMLSQYSNDACVGEYYAKDSVIAASIIRELSDLLLRPELRRAEKFVKTLNLPVSNLFISEVSELNALKSKQSDVRIYCSPHRGYPTLHFLKRNIASQLFFRFWNKLDGCLGLSATLTAGDDDAGRNYIYSRLGFNVKTEDDKANASVENKKDAVYIMPRIFNAEQANIYVVKKNYPAPTINKNKKESVINPKWAESCASTIINTNNGENALVLTGSFDEVDLIAKHLEERGVKNLIIAERGKSAYSKVKEFKEKGGILIGTRNYGTGLDLPGKQLTKLYITKLPFPVMNSRRFLDIREKSNNQAFFIGKREMILNLKQWLGRLIRTFEDKGDIYILDSRMWDDKYFLSVKKTLEQYGIFKK